MKKLLLWNENGIIVNGEDVQQVANCTNYTVFNTNITEFTDDNIDKLNSTFTKISNNKKCEDLDIEGKIEATLQLSGYNTNISAMPDIAKSEKTIVFETYNNSFSDFSDWETEPAYEYWDCSTKKWLFCETETEVEINEDSKKCLDTWNGNSWVSGGVGLHENLYRIEKIDGDVTTDMYLLIKSSQWEGSFDLGEILDKEEVINHLTETNRADQIEEIF